VWPEKIRSQGEWVLVLYFNYGNLDNKDHVPMLEWHFEASQSGQELEDTRDLIGGPKTRVDAVVFSVKPGVFVEVAQAWILKDETSPVIVEVAALFQPSIRRSLTLTLD
jgi:hypothetical protein